MDDIKKSFLTQRYARLEFDPQLSIVGYSVAGEETVVAAPQFNAVFDIGRCPQFALACDHLCLTHGHMDHVGGIAYYLSQRSFLELKPATILCPEPLAEALDAMLLSWRNVERQKTPYLLVPMQPGDRFSIRDDFGIRAVATHHGMPSLGYTAINVRKKLKPEYFGRPGPELAQLNRSGVEISAEIEVPLLSFLGDTCAGPVFEDPDVKNADVLVTECTFYEDDHKHRSKVGKHLHVEDFARILPRLNNKHVVIGHVSRRTAVRRARHVLSKMVGPDLMKRVHFLMDFETSAAGGEVEPPESSGGD